MIFECKYLTIDDDPDFGCTIELCDTNDNCDENQTIAELFNPHGKYLMIQRSYPEDEYDNDWYSIECSEIEIDFNQKDSMYVKLRENEFEIYSAGITITVKLRLPKTDQLKLSSTLKKRFADKVVFLKD